MAAGRVQPKKSGGEQVRKTNLTTIYWFHPYPFLTSWTYTELYFIDPGGAQFGKQLQHIFPNAWRERVGIASGGSHLATAHSSAYVSSTPS